YFVFVILEAAVAILVFAVGLANPVRLLTIGAALNGCVMFAYAILLLYMNRIRLPKEVQMGILRTAIMAWAVLFFGVFTFFTIKSTFIKFFG
ncbi:MAG: hypothetical protein JRJ65_13015, partial [Deltaproteobacteria bacterium]|nr:hypothetical protein [Deltaproteobacteria bacterium]